MRFERVNQQVIHHQVYGEADRPHLVFINSLGTDFRIWEPVRKAFQERFRILCYDKRGHGLSSAPGAPYVMQDHHDDLVALLDRLRFDRAVLCGVSVGGVIAQSIAAASPDRVRGLVLCDTAARIGTVDMWNDRIAAVTDSGIESLADGILERWFSPQYHVNHPVLVQGWRHMLTRTTAAGYAGTSAALRDADLTESSRSINCPALAVGGEHDGATPPALVESLVDILSDCRFELISDCGHLPSIEQPARLVELMDTFFTERHLG